jgi:hypothetical protein
MDRLFARFGLISGLIFSFLIFISYATEDPLTDKATANNLPQMVMAPDINKQFDWAGEIVPFTADARERLDRELMTNTYYHSSTLQVIKLANRYFPTIERILLENGIPDDFKYLAVAESGLRHARSGADACGFWQFRKLAAREYGLEVNDEIDERYHVEKSTEAACKYLKWLKGKFGTWTDASAAYNVGPTNYKKEMSTQREQSFYDMNLNEETGRYVFRLIALKDIMQEPERYGYYLSQEDKYPAMDDYFEVTVDNSVSNWGDFAHKYGVTYRDLKIYNPWLREDKMTVIKNTYVIKVPR